MRDMERLADIGDQVLAGTPIEAFDLTPLEWRFVVGYTQRAVDSYMEDDDAA